MSQSSKSLRSGEKERARFRPLEVLRSSALRPLFAGRHRIVAVLVVTAVCSALAEAAFLAILAQAAASLVEGSSEISISLGPWNTTFQLGFLLTLGVGIAAVRLVLQIIVSFLPARIAAGIQSELRNDLYVAFTHSSWGVQSQDLEGHFQELATNQIAQASQGILQAVVFLIAASTFVILVSSALVLNVFAATLVLVIAIALLAILRPASNLGRHQAQKLSGAYIDYASGVNETVRLAEESRVFGVGESLRERMSGVIYGVGDAFFRTQLMVRLISNGYQSVLYLLIAVALTVLYLVDAGQIAALGAIVLLLIRAGNYGQQIQNAYQVVRQSLPYIERVQAGTRRYEEASIGTGTRPLRSVESVSFDHVSFSYLDDRPALTDVSFKVDAGELIGIVGPSGAGKSTLVQILLGIREPDGGHFLINGEEAAEIRRSDWHRLVSYVPQRPQLLQASVADNISFFRSVSEEDIHRAAVQAGIHDDILSWPDGYDTMVGPRANAISGGEQQRICLARALVANPEVLILDEPTSALDPHSELLIQRSLDELKHQLTLFVVAHRLSTLASCERIMVIVDGKLDKFDRASELRLSSDYFRTATDIVTSATIDQA